MNVTDTKWQGKTFTDLVSEAKNRIQEICCDDLCKWQAEEKEIVILDVREPDDYHKAHIPGALNIPRGLLEIEIDEIVPDQHKTIVVYCGGGSRSALAADTLQIMGYSKVYSLAKGFKGWSQ